MPEGKKVVVRAVLTLELESGLTLEDLVIELEGAVRQTGEDYGENVTVTID